MRPRFDSTSQAPRRSPPATQRPGLSATASEGRRLRRSHVRACCGLVSNCGAVRCVGRGAVARWRRATARELLGARGTGRACERAGGDRARHGSRGRCGDLVGAGARGIGARAVRSSGGVLVGGRDTALGLSVLAAGRSPAVDRAPRTSEIVDHRAAGRAGVLGRYLLAHAPDLSAADDRSVRETWDVAIAFNAASSWLRWDATSLQGHLADKLRARADHDDGGYLTCGRPSTGSI
jgi:hypothetical protein